MQAILGGALGSAGVVLASALGAAGAVLASPLGAAGAVLASAEVSLVVPEPTCLHQASTSASTYIVQCDHAFRAQATHMATLMCMHSGMKHMHADSTLNWKQQSGTQV